MKSATSTSSFLCLLTNSSLQSRMCSSLVGSQCAALEVYLSVRSSHCTLVQFKLGFSDFDTLDAKVYVKTLKLGSINVLSNNFFPFSVSRAQFWKWGHLWILNENLPLISSSVICTFRPLLLSKAHPESWLWQHK